MPQCYTHICIILYHILTSHVPVHYHVVTSGSAPIINGMAIVTVNSLHCGLTYNITAEGIYNNGTLVGPRSSYGAITTGSCPMIATGT